MSGVSISFEMGDPFRFILSAGMCNLVFLAASWSKTYFLAYWQGTLATLVRLYVVRPNYVQWFQKVRRDASAFPPVDRAGICFSVTSSVRYPRLDLSRDTLSIRTIINETESNTLDAQLFFFFYARCQLS